MRCGGLVLVVATLTAGAQTAGAPAGAVPGTGAPAPAAHTYTNTELHVTFAYPAELQPMDAKTLPGAAHNSVFGDDPDAESGNLLTGRCARVLLSVGQLPQSNAGGIWASVLMTAIDPNCIPPKTLKNKSKMDQMLTLATSGGTEILGLVAAAPPAAYTLEGYRIHFAQANGQPVMKGDIQPTDAREKIAVFAVQVNDQILGWKLESNDPALFNRLLTSPVDFGLGTPLPLFPLQSHGDNPQ